MADIKGYVRVTSFILTCSRRPDFRPALFWQQDVRVDSHRNWTEGRRPLPSDFRAAMAVHDSTIFRCCRHPWTSLRTRRSCSRATIPKRNGTLSVIRWGYVQKFAIGSGIITKMDGEKIGTAKAPSRVIYNTRYRASNNESVSEQFAGQSTERKRERRSTRPVVYVCTRQPVLCSIVAYSSDFHRWCVPLGNQLLLLVTKNLKLAAPVLLRPHTFPGWRERFKSWRTSFLMT